MLISSVQDKKGDVQESETMGHSEGLLRCVMSESHFELNLNEVHFGNGGDPTIDSDLDLYFRPKASPVTHEKPRPRPRRYVENVVHEDGSDTELSDDEIYDGIQHINKLNNKIHKILNSARGTGNPYNKVGFTISSDLDRKYDNTLQGQAAYTKDLLYSLNNISGDSITSCFPKSLLDFINTQSDDNTGVYMENVITHVNRTIEQLRKISNGDYLTERAKEKWREVYDYPLSHRAALTHFDKSLIARSCDPLPFNTEPITWNAIVHSDINFRNFNRIYEKKIVIEIPKVISDSFFKRHIREVFVNCKMNSLINSERKGEKQNEEANVIVELQSPIIENIVENSFDRVIFFNSGPLPLPALENHTIAPQIESLPNSPVSNEQNASETALPTQENELVKEPTPCSSCDEIKFLNEDYENFILVASSDDSQIQKIPMLCNASVLSTDVLFQAGKMPSAASSAVYLGELPTDFVSTFDLTPNNTKVNNRFPAIEENNEESPTNKKIKSPPKVRVKSPYENMKFVLEEKRRKKLLEIRQKREQKKRVVAETKKTRATPAPQPSYSVTKLSITNKSFYNSIFGQKKLAIDAQKGKNNATKKETDLVIPNNSEEDAVDECVRDSSVLSTNECRIINRSCYMDDPGIEVALVPNHAAEFSTSVDDVIKELLHGTDEVPVKLGKAVGTPRSPSLPITIQARKIIKTSNDSPRDRTPVNMKNRHTHARHKVSVLECRESIEKVYEFLHNVSSNEPEEVSKRPIKTVSFGNPHHKKVDDQKPKPKSLQQLSKPLGIRNSSLPPFPIIPPMRLDSPRSPARIKESTPRKPQPPSVLEMVINNPGLNVEKKRKVVKKRFSDDDDREARGEAVRGPSITARLNALAQPRKPYLKACNDELQHKAVNFRTMTVNRQRSLSPTAVNKDAAPLHRYRQSRGGFDSVSSMSFRRPPVAPGTLGAERRSRLVPGIMPRPTSPPLDIGPPTMAPQSPKPAEMAEIEPSANIGKKAVSFKEDLKFQRVSANTSPMIVQEIPPPATSPEPKPNMMLRLPTSQDYELLSTTSSTESFNNENKTPGTSSTKVEVSNESDLKCSTSDPTASSDTFNILSQESIMLKEIFSNTAAFTLDIFKDKTVSTAVEAVENDSINNQNNESNSTSELDKLEDALQKQINGSPLRKRLIKNFTLTPKHSMQQVLLLHSGDTGSCIAPLQTPAPSCIKITTSKSDTVAELGVFPLVSNYNFGWENFSFPMQIATVGYAIPQQIDMAKNNKLNVKPLNINACRNPPLNIRPTSKVTRDVKKKNPKNLFKGKKKSETVIKSAAIDDAINTFQNLKLTMFKTLSKTELNKRHFQKCETKSAETITIIQTDTQTKPNDDTSSSLDILVNLLNEIQKITTSQTRIASVANLCQQNVKTGNETDIENSCLLLGSFETKAKEIESITTLEQMIQLDSTPSLYSYMLSSEADINHRIKLTTPLYINKEIGVNFPDKQVVSKYADVNFQTITVNNATNVSESFLKLIEIHRPVLYLTENVTQYSETLILDRVVEPSPIQQLNPVSTYDNEQSNIDILPLADVILDEFEEEIFEKMVEEVIEEEEHVKEEIVTTTIDKSNMKTKKDHTDALLKRIDELLASKTTRELKMVKEIVATKNLVSKHEENKLQTNDNIESNAEIFYDDCVNTEIDVKHTDLVEDSKKDETDNFDLKVEINKSDKTDSLATIKQGVAESDSLMKIKRDILVTVYSVLAVTVFAALSLPEVLYFSDLNV